MTHPNSNAHTHTHTLTHYLSCTHTLTHFLSYTHSAGRNTRNLFESKVFPSDSLKPCTLSTPRTTHNHQIQRNIHIKNQSHDSKHNTPYFNPSESHPFSTIHRIRLIQRIIVGKGNNYCGLHLQSLIEHKCLLTHFALHEKSALKLLAKDWLSLHVMPWEQVIATTA